MVVAGVRVINKAREGVVKNAALQGDCTSSSVFVIVAVFGLSDTSASMEFETPSISDFDLQSKSLFSYSFNIDVDSSDPRVHECDTFELSDSPPSDNPDFADAEALDISSKDDQLYATDDQDSASFQQALVSNLDADSQEIVGKGSEECDCTVYAESPVAEESLGVEAPRNVMTEEKAVLTLQKVYRSYRTRRRLADSAIVAEELWWQAIDYARLNHSTISFFHFSKRETADSRWGRIGLNASKIGKGLCEDVNARKLAFQHWIEAIDPRHRYGHNLHMYYEQWYKADAGQPFFYWLDVGDGKELDLQECPRSKLQKEHIRYVGPKERECYEYIVVEGKIVHKLTGNLLDTSNGLQGPKWIFVMSTDKKLYAGEKKKGAFHHSSFLAGGATLCAGRLVAEYGILKFISTYSGHYRPSDDCLEIFLSFLRENGVDLDQVQVRTANDDYEHYDTSQSNGSNGSESTDETGREMKGNYRRTLSGTLRSGAAEAAKNAIWQRINSKKAVSSYQLGHQLSLKWTTGAGARIGCIADYPVELRDQALEFLNFSPSEPPTPTLS